MAADEAGDANLAVDAGFGDGQMNTVLAADEAGDAGDEAGHAILAAEEAGDAVLAAHEAGDAVLAVDNSDCW